MQDVIVILIVAASAGWLGWQAFRFCYRPARSGKACAGGCCDGQENRPPAPTQRTLMISSDDLRARLKARS